MDTYNITLTGVTPLIQHQDNIAGGERVKAWSKDPANKSRSVPGDDRTPAWAWLSYLYEHDGVISIMAESLMACLRDGGKKCPAAQGRGSMKAATQSGIMCADFGWPLMVSGKPVKMSDLAKLQKELDFQTHLETVSGLGFELLVKRAKIGSSKHVRVRPMFRQWSASGVLHVSDPAINQAMLQTILTFAGSYSGIGDWRPSSPQSPGQYGRFTAEVKKI